MEKLSRDYRENIANAERTLRYGTSFDVLKKQLTVGGSEVTFFYIDGFVKDGELQRVMQTLLSRKELGTAEETERSVPYAEVSVCRDGGAVITAVLSGQTALFAETFADAVILLDLRTYPARQTAEPESDRVMQGSRDGFVETLIMNTALLRRRIRDPRLTMRHFDIGGSSHTDVVVCYMDGIAKPEYIEAICKRVRGIRPESLTLGAQSLSECLVRRRWYNPFPKIRTTERPDTASAQVLEGSILVFCDTSPEVMILPTSIFDFFEEADDFCFSPLVGTYLRLLRITILLLSVVVTPLWYLALEYREIIPETLSFLIPREPGALPIIIQLFLAELALDGLKLASMNTPDMLSNSLSVVGALILGDFAVEVGWFSTDVIFYMACVAIANFAQQNHELGYAFKFMRMLILALVYFLGVWGLAIGLVIFFIALATNSTVRGVGSYLYPLIPFDARAMAKHFIRYKKNDLSDERQ
ncbi:MAG: spore germination protein [Clostridia bacterium]|nr:spore germination protein [Clostridia bacterium]